jgi:CRISPR-associated protein Cmr2
MNPWKRKLAAYLHDPPSKTLDIRNHGERSDRAFRQAGFVDTEVGDYFRRADHTGAAADRLPFPDSRSAALSCAFDGVRNAFLHPFGSSACRFTAEFPSADLASELESSVQPALSEASLAGLGNEDEVARARFFAHWRLWPTRAAEADHRFALLPADTRIPDHTIWNHMQVVSALDGCVQADGTWKPAFLRLQIGPVQDFIAAARSTRDLWSGSYLLSWLMAAGLKHLSGKAGPDAVLFPSLREQPLFDLHWREELWSKVSISDQGSVWKSLQWTNRQLLLPNLPNVLLAILPADQAKAVAKETADAIRAEWNRISASVWSELRAVGLLDEDQHSRFLGQVERFLSITWQSTTWPETLEEAVDWADGFGEKMPVAVAADRVKAVVTMATDQMPVHHRDRRYYRDDSRAALNNPGLAWSVVLAMNQWQLDAVRQTREFQASAAGGWQVGSRFEKDSLTGKEEALAGGADWAARATRHTDLWKALFKHSDHVGAITLVKRCWHHTYLSKSPWSLQTGSKDFPMANTRGIACGDPDAKEDDRHEDLSEASVEAMSDEERYFAVLAFDGDEIGKWMSGEKAPKFGDQLADYQDGSGTIRQGARPYFERPEFKAFLECRRPLSPSHHLQFSEALGNFALLCANRIVEAYQGRLIYAGGDDVLAMLPATKAIACAQALRNAFQGNPVMGPNARLLFDSKAPGFLTSPDHTDDRKNPIPILVPGPTADASVGIAMAHFKAPLQDVVRAATAAEKRAKRAPLNRASLAITLMKRSGEQVEWGTRWDSGGLELYQSMLNALASEWVSQKFPYRIQQLIEPYLDRASDGGPQAEASSGFTPEIARKALSLDLRTAAERQRGREYKPERAQSLVQTADAYLQNLETPSLMVAGLLGLCRTVAFSHRST